MMNDKQLERAVRSVGMECFVKYYIYFVDPSFAIQEIVEIMGGNGEKWTTKPSRVSNGKRLFNAGRHRDALTMVLNSTKTDYRVRADAARLLHIGG